VLCNQSITCHCHCCKSTIHCNQLCTCNISPHPTYAHSPDAPPPLDTQLYHSVHASSTCTTNFTPFNITYHFSMIINKIQRYQTAYISYMLLMIIMNFSLIKLCRRTAFHSLSTCIGPLQVRVHVFAGHQGSSQHFWLVGRSLVSSSDQLRMSASRLD